MTPKRYNECLRALRCSKRGMPIYLGIDIRRGRRYATGQAEIPVELAQWLELLATSRDWRRTLTEHPFPEGWKAADGLSWEDQPDLEAALDEANPTP